MKKKILLWKPVGQKTKLGHLRSVRVPYLLLYVRELLRSHSENFEITLWDQSIERINTAPTLAEYDYIVASISVTERAIFFQEISNASLTPFNNFKNIICVGQDPTACPEIYVDFNIYRGEAELEVVQRILSDTFELEKPVKINKVLDLSQLPTLNFSKQELLDYHVHFPISLGQKKTSVVWGQLLVNRGCPHKCNFCTQIIRETHGHEFRKQDVEKTLKQIRALIAAGANALYFSDDDFTVDKKHLHRLLDRMIEENLILPWTAHARVDEVDFQLLEKMKRAGAGLLRFGIESGSEPVIRNLNKTKFPEKWIENSRKAFDNCHKLNIPTVGLFIIGNPNESFSDYKKTVQLCLQLKPCIIQVHYFTPYSDSYFYKENQAELQTMNLENIYHYQKPLWTPGKLPVVALGFLRAWFYFRFIFRPNFFWQQWFYLWSFHRMNYHDSFKMLRSLRSS